MDAIEGDSSRDNANGPTALNLGRVDFTPTHQADANVNPLPVPTLLQHLRGRQKEPLQDQNTSPKAAGAKANQHSLRPKQGPGSDAGSDKERKGDITTTPLGLAPAAPTPADRLGKSQKPPDLGDKEAGPAEIYFQN